MDFPESIRNAVRREVLAHPNIVEQKAAAIAAARRLAEFKPIERALADQAIVGLVHQIRGELTAAAKSEAVRDDGPREYHAKPKVQQGSAAVRESYGEFMDIFMIGGKRLGDMNAEELLAQADAEEALASGHARNGHFFRQLATTLKKGQRVRDAWSHPKASALYQKIQFGRKAA